MISSKFLFFNVLIIGLILLPFSSCTNNKKNHEKKNIKKSIDYSDDDYVRPECAEERPKCNRKIGIEVKWSIINGWKAFNQKEFFKQVPKNYTGYLKLCRGGQLIQYIQCKNGKVDGLIYVYDCDGSYDEEYFKNFIPEGTWIHYNSIGQYDFVRNFKNGELHGEFISYNTETLKPMLKQTYFEGNLDGESINYYPSGNISEYNKYDKGSLIISKSYYENGNLKSESGLNKFEIYDVNGNKLTQTRPQIKINRP
jgi:antitoxin component YwqK of YwqJK toxin-antitoxin module